MQDSMQRAAVPAYPLTHGQPFTRSLTATDSLFSLGLCVIYHFYSAAVLALQVLY